MANRVDGRTLGELRRAAGFTQSEFGSRAGLTQAEVSRIEQGRVPRPRTATQKAYQRVLRLTSSDFQAALHNTLAASPVVESIKELRRPKGEQERLEFSGLITDVCGHIAREALARSRPNVDWPTAARTAATVAARITKAELDEDSAFAYAACKAFERIAYSAPVVASIEIDSAPGRARKWADYLLDLYNGAMSGDVAGFETSAALAFAALLPLAKADRAGLAYLRDEVDRQRVRWTESWLSYSRDPTPLQFRAVANADVAAAMIEAVLSISEENVGKPPAMPTEPARSRVPTEFSSRK